MNCEQIYYNTYHHSPEAAAFCPYRISPLGAHIDHQFGKINGLAIDKGIHIAYSRKDNGVVELQSLNFPKRAQFHIREIPDEKTYYYWQRRVYEAAKATAEPVFAEVVTPESHGGGIAAAVHSGSVRVEIMNGSDAITVRAILSTLSSC